ncbi:heavy metal translocating P-type ATPase [Striga asiatica]|uniref:Heavy metal translocating P-type ATPase n=1 Tax=Striga asiatica TaxID=4170 RepID=A0A5A7QMV0_STRAF|nr:heavy metal translocating P-type ATPase [Striga asiatica]
MVFEKNKSTKNKTKTNNRLKLYLDLGFDPPTSNLNEVMGKISRSQSSPIVGNLFKTFLNGPSSKSPFRHLKISSLTQTTLIPAKNPSKKLNPLLIFSKKTFNVSPAETPTRSGHLFFSVLITSQILLKFSSSPGKQPKKGKLQRNKGGFGRLYLEGVVLRLPPLVRLGPLDGGHQRVGDRRPALGPVLRVGRQPVEGYRQRELEGLELNPSGTGGSAAAPGPGAGLAQGGAREGEEGGDHVERRCLAMAAAESHRHRLVESRRRLRRQALPGCGDRRRHETCALSFGVERLFECDCDFGGCSRPKSGAHDFGLSYNGLNFSGRKAHPARTKRATDLFSDLIMDCGVDVVQ